MANKPHVHAELIKAWADGAEIEYFDTSRQQWRPTTSGSPVWSDIMSYRIKPERVFPKSSLTAKQRYAVAFPSVTNTNTLPDSWFEEITYNYLEKVADAAVKQYILDTEAKK